GGGGPGEAQRFCQYLPSAIGRGRNDMPYLGELLEFERRKIAMLQDIEIHRSAVAFATANRAAAFTGTPAFPPYFQPLLGAARGGAGFPVSVGEVNPSARPPIPRGPERGGADLDLVPAPTADTGDRYPHVDAAAQRSLGALRWHPTAGLAAVAHGHALRRR